MQNIPSEITNKIFNNEELGIALFNSQTFENQFVNSIFLKWFSGNSSASLTELIPTLDIKKLEKKLNKGKKYQSEIEIKENNRSKIIKISCSEISSSIFITATDYTKEKEVEYLLDSYLL